MREREDGQTKCFNSNFVWGGFIFFFQLIEGFSMEKGPNSPYFKIKKSPRCQIFNISSTRSPRIQRDPYVFLFSYKGLSPNLANFSSGQSPLCLYYKTKQRKKKQKNKEKKHWFQGMGAGRKKGSCQLRYVVAQVGEMGKFPRVYRGARMKHLNWYFHRSKETLI